MTLGQGFLYLFRLSSVIIVPLMSHALLYLNAALVRRTNGQSLGTCKQSSGLPDIGKHWTEKYFHVRFRLWLLHSVGRMSTVRCVQFPAQILCHPVHTLDVRTNCSLRQLITDKLHSFSINASPPPLPMKPPLLPPASIHPHDQLGSLSVCPGHIGASRHSPTAP